MTRARSLSRLANSTVFTVSDTNRVGIGSTQPDVKLDVAGDMNVTGTLTYEDVTNVDTAGITTTGGLVVTGLGATIGGITTFFGDINFGAAGVGGTVTTLGHGGFTGIVTALGFQATGVVTATSFRGDGSQLSGVDSSNLVDSGDTNRVAANTSGIVVTGISTVVGRAKISSNEAITLDNNAHTGETLFLRSGGTAGAGNTQALLAFGKADSSSQRTGSALGSIQTDSDADRIGLAFYTSPGSSSSQTLQEKLRITHDGNFLVAKTTTALDTAGSRVSSGFISLSGDSSSTNLATNSGGAISLANVDSTDNNFSNIGGYNSNGLVVNQIDFINTSHSSRTGEIAFLTHSGSALSERLRIDSSGRILIGRTSTSHEHPLQVQAASGANAIAIQGRSADDQSEITFYENDNSTITAQIQQLVDRSIFRHRAGYLRFDAAGTTESMRLDGSGRLRVGSQSASDRTSHRLQVSSDGSDSLLSLQNFSNSDGSEMDIAFYALNTNNASVKFAQIVARADETQANSSQQGSLKFSVNIGASLTDVAKFNTNGHFVPASNDTFDLGGTSERWRNIYTNDLNLSNEGSANDVDGTWGDYTIQEGENDLFLLNRRNGKKFKFMLQEVS